MRPLAPPPKKMYFIKEVYVTTCFFEAYSKEFLKGCTKQMPNLEIWKFLYTEKRGMFSRSLTEMKEFLNACKYLESALHIKNYEICFNPEYSRKQNFYSSAIGKRKLRKFLKECCKMINSNFPIASTELSILVVGLKERCVKEYGKPAIIKVCESEFEDYLG